MSEKFFINDEAKLIRNVWVFISFTQVVSSTFQVVNYWGEFYDFRFYIFLFILIVFATTLIYFFFFDSVLKVIKHDHIKYFSEKRVLGIRLRYIKLKWQNQTFKFREKLK